MPAVRSIAQLGMDEQIVDVPALESALEERQAAKEANSETRRAFQEASEAANAEIEKLELPDGMVVRSGRFRLERQTRAGRSVSFETMAKTHVKISLLDDGD
jgi:hypothetical protein